ncbi:putative claudin-24 [Synchiropus splendidus]|uniref:putative claudin-24 n=1 Tax=Synchiropus splendidus TaxID=270530 RepID=UPI00237EC138|nr:putative claudin-24 [Synchiropus splendidus]
MCPSPFCCRRCLLPWLFTVLDRASCLTIRCSELPLEITGPCTATAVLLLWRSVAAQRAEKMDSCPSSLELLGMLVFVGAWLCALATTILPQWLTMSTMLLPVESYELGLWETCVVQDVGGMECRGYDSLLGLSSDLKLARCLMCASLAVGMLGILVAVPGLHLVKSCKDHGGHHTKKTFTIIGGVLGMISGVLCLIPVSYMAHLAVMHFFDDKVPDVVPRWEFGDALFCGWAAGFLLIVAGALLVTSCLGSQVEPQPARPQRYHGVNAAVSFRKRSEYV